MKRHTANPELLLASLLKVVATLRLYAENSPVVDEYAQEFIRALDVYGAADPLVTFKQADGRLFFQEEKLSINRGNQKLIDRTIKFLEARSLSGLGIACREALGHPDQILPAVCALARSDKQADAYVWLEQELSRLSIRWLNVSRAELSVEDAQDGRAAAARPRAAAARDPVAEGKRAYSHSVAALKEVSAKVAAGAPSGARKALRSVQNMVNLIMEDEFVLLGLSTIRDYDDYTYAHSVNVAILSISLGARIGLKRETLEALGICGVFHDLGKIKIPLDILNKRGRLTPEEFGYVQQHSLDSVRMMLWLRASRNLIRDVLLAPYEHHLKYDLTGYPQSDRRKPISLFGRIITIADVYDALTSPRIYRTEMISPSRALEMMINESGSALDPVLLKVFINMLGIYPIGTLLKLSSGDLGLVVKNDSKDGARPRVVLMKRTTGNRWKKTGTIRLMPKQGGDDMRDVVGSYHPGVAGIQPAEYLL